jgi:hypothetical protein
VPLNSELTGIISSQNNSTRMHQYIPPAIILEQLYDEHSTMIPMPGTTSTEVCTTCSGSRFHTACTLMKHR